MRAQWVGLTAAALLLTHGSQASAQEEWSVSAGWGASEDLDIPEATSIQSFQLGLSAFGDVGHMSAIGGIPARPGEDATWGQLDVATYPQLGRLGVGLQADIRGRGFAYRDPISGISGVGGLLLAEPYATYSSRSFRLRVGGGVRVSGTSAGGVGDGRVTGVFASDIVAKPGGVLTLRVRLETLLQDTLSLPHGAVSAALDHGRGFLWGGVDGWTNDALPEIGWYAGGSFDLSERLSAETSVGRRSVDPLFWTPARRTWSVALRYRFGDRREPPRGRAVTPVALSEDGFMLRVSESEGSGTISIAGSFNGWKPVPMKKSGASWTIQLHLDPGTYHIAFVDETGRWFVPEAMPGRMPDGMGGFTAVVLVR